MKAIIEKKLEILALQKQGLNDKILRLQHQVLKIEEKEAKLRNQQIKESSARNTGLSSF